MFRGDRFGRPDAGRGVPRCALVVSGSSLQVHRSGYPNGAGLPKTAFAGRSDRACASSRRRVPSVAPALEVTVSVTCASKAGRWISWNCARIHHCNGVVRNPAPPLNVRARAFSRNPPKGERLRHIHAAFSIQSHAFAHECYDSRTLGQISSTVSINSCRLIGGLPVCWRLVGGARGRHHCGKNRWSPWCRRSRDEVAQV